MGQDLKIKRNHDPCSIDGFSRTSTRMTKMWFSHEFDWNFYVRKISNFESVIFFTRPVRTVTSKKVLEILG